MSKIGNKLKSFSRIFRNYTPRKLAITLLAVAALLVPAFIYAATPSQRISFTWDNPAGFVYFNAISNNPYWGDEHDSLRIVDANGNLANTVNVQDGQTYTVEMLVHNDAALNLNLVAKNTRAFMQSGSESSIEQTISGTVVADNIGATTTGNSGADARFTDYAKFTSSSNFKLNYVAGSAKYTTQFSGPTYTEGGKTFQLPDSTVNGAGSTLGFDSMDGNIPGCWPYHGILAADFQVEFGE